MSAGKRAAHHPAHALCHRAHRSRARAVTGAITGSSLRARRGDDCGRTPRDSAGTDHLSRTGPGLYRAGQGLQQPERSARHAGWRTISPARGTVRAGKPVTFPTETVAVSSLLPNFDQYAGPPIELGRMEPTASDPDVQQQYGMTVGTPNSGQVNALGTLNLRGERSVTCKGDRDRARSAGPLPPGSPAVCEEFRAQPDALERAAELDAQFGARPDLTRLPLYCIPFSFKDPYDTKDMRTTAAADARTTSTSLPGITHWWRSCATRAPSSTQRR